MKESNKSSYNILSFSGLIIMLTIFVSLVSILISSIILLKATAPNFLIHLPVIDFRIEEEIHGSGLFHLLKIILNILIIAGIMKIIFRKKSGVYLFSAALILLIIIPFLFLHDLSFYYVMIRQLLLSIFYFPVLIIILSYNRRNTIRKLTEDAKHSEQSEM